MTSHPGIFPTFLLSGFACSTFLWKKPAPQPGRAGWRPAPHAGRACVAALRRWQKERSRVTVLYEVPFSEPVELQDVVDAAHRLYKQPDRDW